MSATKNETSDVRDWSQYRQHSKLSEVNVRRLTRKSLLKFCTTARMEISGGWRLKRRNVRSLDVPELVAFAEDCQSRLVPSKKPPGQRRGRTPALPKLPSSTSRKRKRSPLVRSSTRGAPRARSSAGSHCSSQHPPTSSRSDSDQASRQPQVPPPSTHSPVDLPARRPPTTDPPPMPAPCHASQADAVPSPNSVSAQNPNTMTNNSISLFGTNF